MNKKSIGERIKELRKSYSLNQTEFGKPLGVSYGHISNLEKGKDIPSSSLVKLMAYEYNTTENWILLGEGQMFTHITSSNTSNMESSNELFLQLDDLLCSTPSTIRGMQEEIIESIILFLQANTLLKGACQIKHLEILNNMLKNLYTINTTLHVAKDENDASTMSLASEKRIEKMLDDIYSKFTVDLDNFTEIYINND